MFIDKFYGSDKVICQHKTPYKTTYSPVPIIGTPIIGTKREKIQLLEPIFGFLRSGGKNNYWNFRQLLELFGTVGRSLEAKLTHIRIFLHKFSASLLE